MSDRKYGIQFSLYGSGVTQADVFIHQGEGNVGPIFNLFEFGSLQFDTEREAILFCKSIADLTNVNIYRKELQQFVMTRMMGLNVHQMKVRICVKILNEKASLLSLVELEYAKVVIKGKVPEDMVRSQSHPKLDNYTYTEQKVGFFKRLVNKFKRA
jgi:hypothetical protein